MIHLFFLAALRGIVVRGPMIGKQHAYVLVRDWLGEAADDRPREGAGRAGPSLPGRPPAGDRSRPRQVGRPAAARRPRRPEGDRLRAGGGGGRPGQPRQATRAEKLPPPRLLGAFDPVLLGWTSREDILGPHTNLVTRNGIFHPFAMVKGKAVAKWGLAGGTLTLEPLQDIPAKVAAALDRDAAEVTRFLVSD